MTSCTVQVISGTFRSTAAGSTATPVRRGTRFELLVMLPGKRAAIIVQEARVRWTRGQEFGLCFETVRLDEATRLETYITKKIS